MPFPYGAQSIPSTMPSGGLGCKKSDSKEATPKGRFPDSPPSRADKTDSVISQHKYKLRKHGIRGKQHHQPHGFSTPRGCSSLSFLPLSSLPPSSFS